MKCVSLTVALLLLGADAALLRGDKKAPIGDFAEGEVSGDEEFASSSSDGKPARPPNYHAVCRVSRFW